MNFAHHNLKLIRNRQLIDWFNAAEGWSLPASAMSVVTTVAYLAWRCRGECDWLNAALALAMMMLFQAGSSTLSDVSDHISGVDRPDDPKVTWIYSGLFPLSTLRRYAAALLGLGSLAGLAILCRGNWDAIWLGALGLAIGVGYSFLKYRAFGDLAIFLAFSLLPAFGVGRVVAGEYLPVTMLTALPIGLMIVAIVHANNWRDIESDRAAGIKTLPILVGSRAAAAIYYTEIFLPYALIAFYAFAGLLPKSSLAVFITLPLALLNLKAPLVHLDRATARLLLIFGLVYSIAIIC